MSRLSRPEKIIEFFAAMPVLWQRSAYTVCRAAVCHACLSRIRQPTTGRPRVFRAGYLHVYGLSNMSHINFAAETAITPASPSIPSGPLDLSAISLPQNYGAMAGVKKVVTTVPVRRPGNQAFFRVRPGEGWRISAAILQLREDSDCFLVMPELLHEIGQEVRPKLLYTAMGRDGNPFLWPVSLPGEDGRLDTWSQSAHAAAQLAETSWIRLVANRGFGAYEVMQAVGKLDDPEWPDRSFQELVNLAFKDKVINSLEHPVLRRLRGEL